MIALSHTSPLIYPTPPPTHTHVDTPTCAHAQLTFTADSLDMGGRCLHHDFVRYFGLGRSVICMYQVT